MLYGEAAETWKRYRGVIQSGGSDNVINYTRVRLEWFTHPRMPFS